MNGKGAERVLNYTYSQIPNMYLSLYKGFFRKRTLLQIENYNGVIFQQPIFFVEVMDVQEQEEK